MLYKYKVTTQEGVEQEGTVDAPSIDSAVNALQRRGLIIVYIEPVEKTGIFGREITFLSHVSSKEVVIMSRQIATLFEASVSVLSAFKLLASESSNPQLRSHLRDITDDIQGGVRISEAMSKHPKIFSSFYVNMIKAGEESGRLPETFTFLADSLERTYELVQKAKNALIYPIFVIGIFIIVMVLMMVFVIPQLSAILLESGQQLPIYTTVVIGISNFLVQYGVFVLVLLIVAGIFLWRFSRTDAGRFSVDHFKISIPYIGDLYRKLYLARISDGIDTMLEAGIPMVRTLEITADVVNNAVYKNVLLDSAKSIKGGSSVAQAFDAYPDEMPIIMVQMARVGEETGKLGQVLKTIAKFYKREVDGAVDTLIGLIEPLMIVILGLGVGIVLASVLIPMYSITSAL